MLQVAWHGWKCIQNARGETRRVRFLPKESVTLNQMCLTCVTQTDSMHTIPFAQIDTDLTPVLGSKMLII